MFRHRPAMKFAVPLSCGIILGYQWTLPLWVPLALLAAAAALFAAVRSSPAQCAFAFWLLIFSAGAAKIASDARVADPGSVGLAAGFPDRVLLSGRLLEPPRFTPRAVHFILDAETLAMDQRPLLASGGVVVTVRRGKG